MIHGAIRAGGDLQVVVSYAVSTWFVEMFDSDGNFIRRLGVFRNETMMNAALPALVELFERPARLDPPDPDRAIRQTFTLPTPNGGARCATDLRNRGFAVSRAIDGVTQAQILRQQVLSDERFFRDLPEAPPNDWRRLAMAVRKFLIYSDKRRQALADGKVAEIEDVLRAYTVQMDTGLKTLLGELT